MIIFFYGADTYRSLERLKELKAKFLKDIDPSGNSLNILDGSSCDLSQIKNIFSTASLFVRRRMLIIENIFSLKSEDSLAQILSYLETLDPSDKEDNILIFRDDLESPAKLNKTQKALFKFLSQGKYNPKPFNPLAGADLSNWIKSEAANNGAQIEIQAILLLASLVGNNLWQLANEIKKLAHYKLSQNENLISAKDVEAMTIGQVNASIFTLMDAIAVKNKSLALKLLTEQIESGSNELQILAMINRQFKILAEVRSELDQGLNNSSILAKKLSIHPFVAQKSLAQARGYTLEKLKNILNKLIEIDFNFKQGRGTVLNSLELLILKN